MWDYLNRVLKDTIAAFQPPGYLESLDLINDVSVDGLSKGIERFGDVSSQFHIDPEDHYDRHKQQHIGSHMQMDVGPASGGKNPWSERLGMEHWSEYGSEYDDEVAEELGQMVRAQMAVREDYSREAADLKDWMKTSGEVWDNYINAQRAKSRPYNPHSNEEWAVARTLELYVGGTEYYESLYRPDVPTNSVGTPLVESLRTDVGTNRLGLPLTDPNSVRTDRWMETPIFRKDEQFDRGDYGRVEMLPLLNSNSPSTISIPHTETRCGAYGGRCYP